MYTLLIHKKTVGEFTAGTTGSVDTRVYYWYSVDTRVHYQYHRLRIY